MTAIACLMALGCQAQQQTDEFTTKSGKKVRFTCIKHASIQINYNGLEIQVDPVGKGMKPETDYSQFPKADIILVTHEHHDHFDSDAIAQLTKASTKIYLNPAVHKMFGSGKALKNGDKVKIANDITIEAVPAYNTTPPSRPYQPTTPPQDASSSTPRDVTTAIYSPSTVCVSTLPATPRTSPRWPN